MAVARKTTAEAQVFILVSRQSFFWKVEIESRNQIALIAQNTAQVPIAVKFNVEQSLDGFEFFLHELKIGKSVHFPFSGKKSLLAIEFSRQTLVVAVVDWRKKVEVVVADAQLKIYIGFL